MQRELFVCLQCESLLCEKCVSMRKTTFCSHQHITTPSSTLYKHKEFKVFYSSLEFFGRQFQANPMDQVFLNFVFFLLKRASLEGHCLVEKGRLLEMIREQFHSKMYFEEDYIEHELFKSPVFRENFIETQRKFGQAEPVILYSLRLRRFSLQAIHLILQNLRINYLEPNHVTIYSKLKELFGLQI